MASNSEFALQISLIWLVFRTIHQFVPGICKVWINMVCSRCFHNGRICVIIDVNRSAVERCIGTLSVFGALLVRTERVFQRLPVLSMASWEVIVPLRWSPGPVPLKARGTGVLSAKCSFLARGAISWTPQRTCLGLKERPHIVGRCCKA